MVERLTFESMPFLIFTGAFMSLGSTFSVPIILLLMSVHVGFLYWIWSLRKHPVSVSDIRFLFVPLVVWIIALCSGGYHVFPSFYDQAEHLMISNRILDRCECGLLKQQTDGLFRPELIPGIAAIELAWSGETYKVYLTPLLLLFSTGWAIQLLAEQYTPQKLAMAAPMAFLLLPIVIVYGRTMLLDIGIAGMIVSSMLYFRKIENKSEKYIVFFGAMIASIGMAKYSYIYLGPWIILIFYIRDHKKVIKPFALGWGGITLLNIIKNILLTGGLFSPMNQQITGTMNSIKSTDGEIGDYGTLQFILEYVDQWSILLLVCAVVGFAILIKKEKDILWHTWALIAPAMILHGVILDFGWVRYSTPWLALACIGIPAFLSSELFSIQVNHKHVKPFLVSGLIILLLSVYQTSALLIEEREEVKIRSQVHWTIANIYVDAGRNVDDNAIFVTGTSDWNLELYSSKTSYQFENDDDPVYNSIIEFEASHLLTQTRGWRYDIDVNWTYLYGSPVMPYDDFWSGSTEGYLWSVNESRLSTHSWWTNQTITLLGDGSTFGDFMYLEHETMYVIPENTSASKIIQINNESELSSAYRAISGGWTRAEVLCDSVIECREFSRDDFLDERWLVWVAQD
jgi:hypothetical protein